MRQSTQNRFYCFLLTAIIILSAANNSIAQVPDTTIKNVKPVLVDTVVPEPVNIKKHSPKKAAIRSAVIPGWGQAYNKKYWKIPIIYAGLGITGGIFIYNLESYKDTKFAYRVKYNMRVYHTDSASYAEIKDYLKPLSEESLRYYRNQYRRDIDYATIFFLIIWGLNVVDATVDAHLKGFDVGPDLGLRIKPGYSELAGTTGVSLVLKYKDKTSR